jgi:hypothetical protein
MSRSHAFLAACALALAVPALSRAEPAVLSLARAYLGPQSSLDSIQSVHYVGTLERVDPDHDAAPVKGTLDMIFAKPLRQRLRIAGPRTTMLTVLDGYDAWTLVTDNADRSKTRFAWLAAGDIRSLRDTTWENLYYYSKPEQGTVEDKGGATVDGIECERVDFTHGLGAAYERFFDRDTGRLVLTVRGSESIRESGEVLVEGVRFPKVVVSRIKLPSGREVVSTASFTSITLNENLPPSAFAAPTLLPGTPPAPTSKTK